MQFYNKLSNIAPSHPCDPWSVSFCFCAGTMRVQTLCLTQLVCGPNLPETFLHKGRPKILTCQKIIRPFDRRLGEVNRLSVPPVNYTNTAWHTTKQTFSLTQKMCHNLVQSRTYITILNTTIQKHFLFHIDSSHLHLIGNSALFGIILVKMGFLMLYLFVIHSTILCCISEQMKMN